MASPVGDFGTSDGDLPASVTTPHSMPCKRPASPASQQGSDSGRTVSRRPSHSAHRLPSSSLLTLDRLSLSLVLQHLPWRDKLLEVSHLCRALPCAHSSQPTSAASRSYSKAVASKVGTPFPDVATAASADGCAATGAAGCLPSAPHPACSGCCRMSTTSLSQRRTSH